MVNREMEPDRGNPVNRFMHMNATRARASTSGGYLALMIGFIGESHQIYGDCGYSEYSSRVQAVVSQRSFYDLKGLYETATKSIGAAAGMSVQERLEGYLEGNPEEAPERYRDASPSSYVSDDDPPVLTFYSEADTVPVEHVEMLDALLQEFGVPHTVLAFNRVGDPMTGQKNVIVPQSGADEEEGPVLLEEAMFAFFDEHLK
ncbi:MAG: hypothetical protein CL911_05640 [Deltaproteobacteria bacterium]|nr:hypothetical protein [Deltaproteobacteria bacterium]